MEKQKEKIAAVVVTYNRKELLKECLDSLLNQTYPVDGIMLIDNASTDKTPDYLKENGYLDNSKIDYIRLPENTGGAGGFHCGIKNAYERGFDWIWLMDDDTVPSPDALESLITWKGYLDIQEQDIGFLASNVFWVDGNICLMNISKPKSGSEGVYKHLDKGIIELQTASFVSLLVSREAVSKVGLPIKEFFIWLDDVEYTKRISNSFKGFLVGKSKVIHKTKLNSSPDYGSFKKEELWKYRCGIRNRIYLAKSAAGFKNKLLMFMSVFFRLYRVLFSKNFKYFPSILISFLKGLFFSPEIERANQ